ncbi:Sterol 3-beta-glucosyltransferase ATG26 [Fusarium oxysporum f. sp. albedinis]|nr:Sterol 3-beta-glucosyltransferase ATG26 [Fusarium oxysporum f. sp. albedinis]
MVSDTVNTTAPSATLSFSIVSAENIMPRIAQKRCDVKKLPRPAKNAGSESQARNASPSAPKLSADRRYVGPSTILTRIASKETARVLVVMRE